MDLKKSLFLLPNLLTLSSLLCGFYAIALCGEPTSDLNFQRAALFIVYAMLFDTVDGRVARMTKTQSSLGMQLDSLVDAISFGVAPSLLVYRWSLDALGWFGLIGSFAFLACATVRLARFNVLSMGPTGSPRKPDKYVVGLPAPGAAGILVSLISATQVILRELPGSPLVVLTLVALLSFFMVGTIRFRSFKDLRLSWLTLGLLVLVVAPSIFITIKYNVSVALIWLLTAYVAIGVLESMIRWSSAAKAKLSSRGHLALNTSLEEEAAASAADRSA